MDKRKIEESHERLRQRRDEIRQESKAKYLDRAGERYADVLMLVGQTDCTESQAAEALVYHHGDLANALVELTC